MAKARGSITYEIKEEIANLGPRGEEWSLQLNLVSWNGADAKYDIRPWNKDHTKCGSGLTMSSIELAKLGEALESNSPPQPEYINVEEVAIKAIVEWIEENGDEETSVVEISQLLYDKYHILLDIEVLQIYLERYLNHEF